MQTEPLTGRAEKINDLLHDPKIHEQLRNAEVILGVDEETGGRFPVFGKRLLQQIARHSRQPSRDVMVVPSLQVTDELEALIVAVNHINCYNDYDRPQDLVIRMDEFQKALTNSRAIHSLKKEAN